MQNNAETTRRLRGRRLVARVEMLCDRTWLPSKTARAPMEEATLALRNAELLLFYGEKSGSTEDFIRAINRCFDVAEAQLPKCKFPRDMAEGLWRSFAEELRSCRDEVDRLQSWFLLEEE